MRAVLLIGATIFGLLFAYCTLLAILVIWHPGQMDNWFRPQVSEQFVLATWNSSKFGDPHKYKMANSLVRSGRLKGMPEAEVRSLLGQPSSVDTIGGFTLIGYDLVPQRNFPARCCLLPKSLFMNTDTWLLEIQCQAGRVTATRIRST